MQIGNLTWVCCNYDGNGKYNNINFSQSVAMVKRILSNLENSVPIISGFPKGSLVRGWSE